jgi:hypothetical protein
MTNGKVNPEDFKKKKTTTGSENKPDKQGSGVIIVCSRCMSRFDDATCKQSDMMPFLCHQCAVNQEGGY